MNKFADKKKAMGLDNFFTCVFFDITGILIFSDPFGR